LKDGMLYSDVKVSEEQRNAARLAQHEMAMALKEKQGTG